MMPRVFTVTTLRWPVIFIAATLTLGGCSTAKHYGQGQAQQGADSSYNYSYDDYYGQPAKPRRNDDHQRIEKRCKTVPYSHSPMMKPKGNPHAKAKHSKGKVSLKANAPKQYTVKKDDNLWKISQKYLRKPGEWNSLMDPKTKKLYPGDKLRLTQKQCEDVLIPRIHVERGNYIGEPISTLAPFMVWPRVLDQATIDRAPYILSARDDHHLITAGHRVYAKHLYNAQKGERFGVYHPDRALKDPETDEILGYEVSYNGYARLEHVDHLATLDILEAKREIRAGDRLLPRDEDMRHHLNAPIAMPTFKVRGDIISLFDAEYLSGNYMVAAINRGVGHGIQPGHVLGVYSPGRTVADPHEIEKGRFGIESPSTANLPPERVADLVVYKVTDRLSYGVIMKSSREVSNGYKIGNP